MSEYVAGMRKRIYLYDTLIRETSGKISVDVKIILK